MVTERLGGRGVWSAELRFGDPAQIVDAAAELEALGYSAAWVPDVGGPLFEDLYRLLQVITSGRSRNRHPLNICKDMRSRATSGGGGTRVLPEDHRKRDPAVGTGCQPRPGRR